MNEITTNQRNPNAEIQYGTKVYEDENEKETQFQNPIDLDYVLTNELGQFGQFQLRNLLMVAVFLIVSGSMGEYIIFSSTSTPHRCRIPECGEDGKFQEYDPQWINNAIPETQSGLSSCERFTSRGINGTLDFCPANLFDQSNTIACEDFVYARNNTVVYEFNLGCNEWLRVLAGTLYNTGMLLALPITGFVSDRFGRKTALVINIFNLSVFGLIRAFSVSYSMYMVLQIVQTTLGSGAYSSAFIIASEMVGPRYRVITGATCSAMFSLGEAMLGSIAWLISPWRYVIMATTIPCFFFVSYYWLLTESVRWLLSKRKYTEASKILHNIARINQTQISEKSMEALLNPPQCSTKTSSAMSLGLVRTILKSPVLLRRVFTTAFWWIAMTFIYYGLSINSTSLSDTMYLNYILTALVSIPGFYTSAFFLNTIGRKATIASAYFISAACNISFIFVPREFTIPRLILYLLGKFFIAAVGSSLYVYTTELYPTEYRHTLLGFSSMVGRIGSISAPLTPALTSYWHGLPSLLFGAMGALAGLLVLTQPDTRGRRMPDTLAEAERIGELESTIAAD